MPGSATHRTATRVARARQHATITQSPVRGANTSELHYVDTGAQALGEDARGRACHRPEGTDPAFSAHLEATALVP